MLPRLGQPDFEFDVVEYRADRFMQPVILKFPQKRRGEDAVRMGLISIFPGLFRFIGRREQKRRAGNAGGNPRGPA